MLRLATSIAVLASVSMRAQSTTPPQVRLPDVLPQTVRTTQIVLAPDGHRAYYGDSSRAIWFYDRSDRRSVRIADGEVWDLTLSPTGDALAYAKTSTRSADREVWVL